MLQRMIVILGENGQVSRALSGLLGPACVALGQNRANFCDIAHVLQTIEAVNPSAVINAAAYTQVDKAEEEQALARKINTESPGAIARWCAAKNIPFVHYSTDYVFDGSKNTPRGEEDPTNPINVYGASKQAGEQAIAAAGGQYLIFRTSWVYDDAGKNFLNTMLKLGADREELRVVADQIGAPTYAPHIAAATLEALQAARSKEVFPSDIYHLCNAGETSWHGFAEMIFAEARSHGAQLAVKRIVPIPSTDYPTPAKRPLNSRLSCEKIARALGVKMPTWQEGLKACMKKKYGHP